VANLFPAPNLAGREDLPNNYFSAPSDSDDADQYDLRGDHYLTDNQRIFVRYSRRNQNKAQPGPLPMPADGASGQTIDMRADNLAFNHSTTIGAAKHNEIRVGWTHFPGNFDHPFKENLNKTFGIKNAPGETFGMASIRVTLSSASPLSPRLARA